MEIKGMYSHFLSSHKKPSALNQINAQKEICRAFSFFFIPFHPRTRVKMPRQDSRIQKEYSTGEILTEANLSPRPKGKNQNPESVQTPFSHQLTQIFMFEDWARITDPVTQGSSLKLKRWTWQAVIFRPSSFNDLSGPLQQKKKLKSVIKQSHPLPHPGDSVFSPSTEVIGVVTRHEGPWQQTRSHQPWRGWEHTYGPDYWLLLTRVFCPVHTLTG